MNPSPEVPFEIQQEEPHEEKAAPSKYQDVIRQLRHFAPMFLSHHPMCQRFSNHTIKIGPVNLCIGCFIGYPSAILSILFWYSIIPKLDIPLLYYFLVGFFLFSAQLLSFTNLTERKHIKILQKFCVGFGAGLILITMYYLLGAKMTSSFKVIAYVSIAILGTPIALLHYRTMKLTCNTCDFKWNPQYCHIDMCLADIKYAYYGNPTPDSTLDQNQDENKNDDNNSEKKS